MLGNSGDGVVKWVSFIVIDYGSFLGVIGTSETLLPLRWGLIGRVMKGALDSLVICPQEVVIYNGKGFEFGLFKRLVME